MVQFTDCQRYVGNLREAVVEDLCRQLGCSRSFFDSLIKKAEHCGEDDADLGVQLREFKSVADSIGSDGQVWWYRTGSAFDSTAGYALVRNNAVEAAMQLFRS